MTSESLAEAATENSAESAAASRPDKPELAQAIDLLKSLKAVVCQQVLGRDDVIELAIIALMADGHVLLEDFPGSGKTTLAKALGEAIVSDSADGSGPADENQPGCLGGLAWLRTGSTYRRSGRKFRQSRGLFVKAGSADPG